VNLVVKLCDVAPDGSSTLITTGWLRGTHRLSSEEPSPVAPGRFLEYRVHLWATSYLIAAGHRLRVSVSCADFPRIWPTATNPLIRLACGGAAGSRVELPVIAATGAADFTPPPEPDPDVARTPLDIEAAPTWTIAHDLGTDTVTVTTGVHSMLTTPGRDGRFEIERHGRASVSRQHPGGARVEGEAKITLQTPAGSTVIVEGNLHVTQFGEHFSGRVTVDGATVFDQRWER
jgi:hypothetical protein